MKEATLVKRLTGNRGDQHLWRCKPPMKNYEGKEYEYVITSAAVAMFTGPETYIFPSDKNGEVTDWGELPGSMRGVMDGNAAIRSAGYTVVVDVIIKPNQKPKKIK